ncbi:hypothetical protein E1B28_009920 [Marasmius oreades]|uniref:C2H2-type domain-containing protein n=1 Tax=Marasmius oreades TaxID=181124 RepID=A0A9P7RXH8_9AGAR|nr:uncharacterized protein E1B28_009920 [Marasmius oreades]KAG7090838.1 hypothetical protein E1B28_009920 [Marasmius oreades]
MENQAQQVLFTCISCTIAFFSAEEQRVHYRSDHHRYNMKRRVAGLPPVSAATFNEKVLERRAETSIMSSLKGSSCELCNKIYSSENAYRSHINSKKHKDNELKAAREPPAVVDLEPEAEKVDSVPPPQQSVESSQITKPAELSETLDSEAASISLVADEDADEDEVNQTIDQKIAAARSRLSNTHCLFCPIQSPTIEENLSHMSSAHSFFIPDSDYLIDLPGLITYLGEKIAVGNVCIYCNGKGREFRTLDAVRKHMTDKSHCKVAYETENDRFEISDYYDFTSSYGDVKSKLRSKKIEEEEWEDMSGDEGDEDVDEIVEHTDEDELEGTEDLVPESEITYGDSHLELVLPSGARIGHRSLRRYYAQSFTPLGNKASQDPSSGAAIVRRLLADKNSDLVPVRGGYGAFGSGTQVVKARNRGEAREAGRHVREFRDQARREHFKTKVAFRHNQQKHYRDPLLQ